MRYKLVIAYRGTRYHGWQRQLAVSTWKGPTPAEGKGIPTIQETLATAIGGVVHHPINLVGSSRTDARVHAKGQVAHFDTDQTHIPPEGLRLAVNHQLPDDMLVRSIEAVPDDFDAILSTTSKRYQYVIWNALDRNPFADDLCWHRWRPLDVQAMRTAAAHLVGTRDFASFARAKHGRDNSVRTILSIDIAHRAPRIVIGIEGTGFLWNMVRIIVGTLAEVGLGHRDADEMPAILSARDRQAAGGTAPPQGLWLQWIKFRESQGAGAEDEEGGE
jgi:tRNA pseudouridine38-40 synthase